MMKVFLGLISTQGDRLGHLVRSVQMLSSYGHEAKPVRFFDVVNSTVVADQPPALCTVVECACKADRPELDEICREVEWALGEDHRTLQVVIARCGDKAGKHVPTTIQALLTGELEPGMQVMLSRETFTKLCGWGQQLLDGTEPVIGEQPGATGATVAGPG